MHGETRNVVVCVGCIDWVPNFQNGMQSIHLRRVGVCFELKA